MDEAFAGLTSYCCIVDNIIIYDSDITEHTDHVTQFLQSCAEKHITMNVSKWKFAQPQADFAGFTVAADGYRIDQSIIEAIAIFPTPTNHTDLRSFVSLVNQLLAITATLAGLLTLLHPLLSTKNEFTWSSELDQAFTKAKESLTSAPTLSYFDPSKPTRLCTDTSRQGLGFVLQQKLGDNWVLIQAGSRFISDTESQLVCHH